ncbi:MAG: hypothetical protein ABWY00_06280 [Dongiaceae bacterium]
MQVWPAVGGGLLVGTRLPIFDGNRPVDSRFHPNLFVTVDHRRIIRITVPYVILGQAPLTCILDVFATELDLEIDRLRVDDYRSRQRQGEDFAGFSVFGEFAEDGAVGNHLRVVSFIVRSMLIAAAAQLWHVHKRECAVWQGLILHRQTRRCLRYEEVAVAAALERIPDHFTLDGSRYIKIVRSGAMPARARTGTSGRYNLSD